MSEPTTMRFTTHLREDAVEAMVHWPEHDLSPDKQDELDCARHTLITAMVRQRNRYLQDRPNRRAQNADDEAMDEAEKIIIQIVGYDGRHKELDAANAALKKVLETRNKYCHDEERISRSRIRRGLRYVGTIAGVSTIMLAIGLNKSCHRDIEKDLDPPTMRGR